LAGYHPLVVANKNVYKDLIEQATSNSKVKRQTPLVNAGYAVQVLAISHVIQSFVSFHQRKNTKKIDIVLLGCGMDVIGFWAVLLDPEQIRVIKVDTLKVCSIKKDLLVQQSLIEPIIEALDEKSGTMQGRI
jgi:hypothetical protein